jgi:hypothetical protein
MDDTTAFPVGFYISLALLAVAGAYAWKVRETGVGIPMGAVLATVGLWYFGDALYNPYETYVVTIGPQYLEAAWWQVALFILAFFIFVQIVHRVINRKLLGDRSQFMDLMRHGGIDNPEFQKRIDVATQLVLSVWIGLMIIGLINTNFNFAGLFAPYISGKSYPWARGRIGGNLDAFISFFNYLHIMLAAAFGIILAVSKNPRTRSLALLICVLTLPWFLLDRTRNTMLAVALPGLLAWVFVRLKGGMLLKVGILLGMFLIAEGWMKFVIETRSGNTGANVALAFQQLGIGGVVETVERSEAKHEGLNMFEELAWCNNLIDKGTYQINMGQRYFAELVNPIPRGLWPGKPLIGIDYAIARGQLYGDQKEGEAGVGATISTGMIGQGVVNFGPYFGVLSSALLMAFWVAILARQDLKGDKTGRMLLFFIGCVLTFNLGRDITLITLYPFVFGYVMLTIWAQVHGEK